MPLKCAHKSRDGSLLAASIQTVIVHGSVKSSGKSAVEINFYY